MYFFSFKFLPLILLFQRLCIFGFFGCFFNCGKHNAFPCLYMRSLSYQSQKRQIVLRSTIRNQYHGTQIRNMLTFVLPGSGAWGPWWTRKSLSTCRQQCDWLQLEPARWLEVQPSSSPPHFITTCHAWAWSSSRRFHRFCNETPQSCPKTLSVNGFRGQDLK